MTTPAAPTLEREKDKRFVTDSELQRRLGVPERIFRRAIRMLDADPRSTFPKKQKLWGDRRWWPAVEKYLDKTGGILRIDADRVAPENRDRTRLPRRSSLRSHPAEGHPND